MLHGNGRLESRWYQAGEHQVHARVGADPGAARSTRAVVLVNGLVISSLYMVATAERLAGLYHVYAPDLPGFGRSSRPAAALDVPQLADALRLWMDAAGIERATLVGNSLGCQILIDLAARYPARVQRLVLAGPTIDPDAREPGPQIRRWLLDWTLGSPALAFAHLVDYRRAGVRRAYQTFRHALRDPVEAKLPRVKIPTLIVRGGRDRIVPQSWAERATGLLPRGTLVVLPGAPHAVNYAAAQSFARLVEEFIEAG